MDCDLLKRHKLDEKAMEAFCHIGYHGSDPNMTDSADYVVADDVAGGQLDIQFCSLACLKRWFCAIIDKLAKETRSSTGPTG
jgi:hypothetical protein